MICDCGEEMTRHVPNWGKPFYLCSLCYIIKYEESSYTVESDRKMTRHLATLEDFEIASFYGGSERGKMITLCTISHEGHGDLDYGDVVKLIMILFRWLWEYQK